MRVRLEWKSGEAAASPDTPSGPLRPSFPYQLVGELGPRGGLGGALCARWEPRGPFRFSQDLAQCEGGCRGAKPPCTPALIQIQVYLNLDERLSAQPIPLVFIRVSNAPGSG